MQAHEDESQWPLIDETYEFVFAIEPMCFIEMIKSDEIWAITVTLIGTMQVFASLHTPTTRLFVEDWH